MPDENQNQEAMPDEPEVETVAVNDVVEVTAEELLGDKPVPEPFIDPTSEPAGPEASVEAPMSAGASTSCPDCGADVTDTKVIKGKTLINFSCGSTEIHRPPAAGTKNEPSVSRNRVCFRAAR